MYAKALTPRDLFDHTVSYEIPPFQRPYVWTEEDQWQPLWNDLEALANTILEDEQIDEPSLGRATHFLGAVVLKRLNNTVGDPERRAVIDGQQRLTTLQLLLDAAQLVVEELGFEDDAESIQELVVNSAKRFKGTSKRFKLWPSRADRAAFECAMDNALDVPEELADSRTVAAHDFFRNAIREWALAGAEAATGTRLSALTLALQQALQIVTIELGDSDDDQLIFETLNDRGTPLLAADLIKNYVFQESEGVGADVDRLSEVYWQDFDGEWWREQVSQGRLFRSRIDLFLQYWLTMRMRAEIPTDAVFKHFRAHASDSLSAPASAEGFLLELKRDADKFRELADLDPTSSGGRFYQRVVESLELGAFIPLLLWMISDNHEPPADEVDRALSAVESWAVRRTLLRRTMKNVNQLVVAMLDHLEDVPLDRSGEEAEAFLLRQTADARVWPLDDEVRSELPENKVYGSIKQQRLRTILSVAEMYMRTQRHEDVTLPTKLELEHVMPRGWRTYWGQGIAHDPVLSAERDKAVNTIGNLTLVTRKLNVALSNRPWRDEEAAEAAPTGSDAGIGKRSLLSRYSILVLNKDIVDGSAEGWTEQDIAARSHALADLFTRVWPRPGDDKADRTPGTGEADGSSDVAEEDAVPPIDRATVDDDLDEGQTDQGADQSPLERDRHRFLSTVIRGASDRLVAVGFEEPGPVSPTGYNRNLYVPGERRWCLPVRSGDARDGFRALLYMFGGENTTENEQLLAAFYQHRALIEEQLHEEHDLRWNTHRESAQATRAAFATCRWPGVGYESDTAEAADRLVEFARGVMAAANAAGVAQEESGPIGSGEVREGDELETAFHREMLDVARRAKSEAGYNATYFARMLGEIGGLATAKQLLGMDEPSDGFTALWERQRLDLTVEARILDPRFAELFSRQEIETARARLLEYGFDPST